MSTPNVTITGTLFDSSGNIIAGGTVVFTLSNLGSWPPVITSTGLLATLSITATSDMSGNFSVNLWGNAQISPVGTFWTMAVYAPGSNQATWEASYIINAGGSYVLSNMTPIVPVSVSGGSGGWGWGSGSIGGGSGGSGGSTGGSSIPTSTLQNYFIVPGFYDVSAFCPNQFSSNQLMFLAVLERAVSFPANLTGSTAICAVEPTATVSFTLEKNGVAFGTLSFVPASPPQGVGIYSATATTFAAGDVLSIYAQSMTDNTFSGLAFTLAGTTS